MSRFPMLLLAFVLSCSNREDDNTSTRGDAGSAGTITTGGSGSAGRSNNTNGGNGGSSAASGGAGGTNPAAAGAGGSANAGAAATSCSVGAGVIYCNDFNDDPIGAYSEAQLESDWNAPTWSDGVAEGRVSIAGQGDERYLRVVYPQGAVGPGPGGAQWKLALGATHDELYTSYRVRFAPGFDFVMGGKLPGLSGGAHNTGGDKPTGSDGWSMRMMWRGGGAAVFYAYYMDQPGNYGEDIPFDLGGERRFEPGAWHRVVHRVKMNTAGQPDGELDGWFDGQKACEQRGLRYRASGATFGIDILYFSTFFGGSGSEWAPKKDEHVDFDDFIVSTTPIAP